MRVTASTVTDWAQCFWNDYSHSFLALSHVLKQKCSFCSQKSSWNVCLHSIFGDLPGPKRSRKWCHTSLKPDPPGFQASVKWQQGGQTWAGILGGCRPCKSPNQDSLRQQPPALSLRPGLPQSHSLLTTPKGLKWHPFRSVVVAYAMLFFQIPTTPTISYPLFASSISILRTCGIINKDVQVMCHVTVTVRQKEWLVYITILHFNHVSQCKVSFRCKVC